MFKLLHWSHNKLCCNRDFNYNITIQCWHSNVFAYPKQCLKLYSTTEAELNGMNILCLLKFWIKRSKTKPLNILWIKSNPNISWYRFYRPIEVSSSKVNFDWPSTENRKNLCLLLNLVQLYLLNTTYFFSCWVIHSFLW